MRTRLAFALALSLGLAMGAAPAMAEKLFGAIAFSPSTGKVGGGWNFAAKGDAIQLPLEDLRTAAQALKTATGLNLLPTVARLENSSTCSGGVLSL